jgi:superkiller protein 3
MNLGVVLHRQGKADEAIACFRKAIALDPKNASAHTNLGIALQQRGKLAEAENAFRRAIVLDPKLAAAHLHLGNALRGAGRTDEAIACYRKALELQPNLAAAKKALEALGAKEAAAPPAKAHPAEADLKEAEAHLKASRWCEVRIALARAEGRLAKDGPKELRERVERMQKDVEMVLRLEEVRLGRTDGKGGAEAHYAAAFRAYGIDVAKLKTAEAADRVRASAVQEKLLAALDAWSMVRQAGATRKAVQAVLDAADADPWRCRLRRAVREKDGKALAALARDEQAVKQSPTVILLLAEALRQANLPAEAVKVLRQGQAQHPGDFWLNFYLGQLLSRQEKGRDEAVGYYRAALAVRPNTPAIHVNLGVALAAKGKREEAIPCFRRALALDPKSVPAYLHLGKVHQELGKMDEAIACFRAAIALAPDYTQAHSALGGAMVAVGKLAEAEACFRNALRLDPKYAPAHLHLGNVLRSKGQLDDAISCYRQALELQPDLAAAKKALAAARKAKEE